MDTSNMTSSMPSQITSSDQKTNSQIIVLIGFLVLMIVLVGIYYWYQYNKDIMTALPQEEVKGQDSDPSLSALEAEISAEETNNMDAELEAIEKELAP